MRIPRTERARGEEEAIVPLINVVFLLLIFFMLVGTLAPPDRLPVDPPISATEEAADTEGLVIILDADGRLAVDDDVLPLDPLTDRVAERLADQPALSVRVKADAAAPSGALVDLLDRLQSLGLERVVLLTTQHRG